MTTTQKIIKYGAIVFAVFLIVSIFSGIFGALSVFSRLFDDGDAVGEMKLYAVEGDVESLEIDLGGARLEIKSGDKFSVESNQERLSLENRDGLLQIKENSHGLDFSSEAARVILTVPEKMVFHQVNISTGAGTVKIEELQAEELLLDLGAGEVNIDNLVAASSAKINGGAGELNIDGGALAGLDFDMGVGEANLKSRLTGVCEMDYGVGELNLALIGTLEDYRITLDKGVGSATLDGKKMYEDEIYGSGDTALAIDGGVGGLKIEFTD